MRRAARTDANHAEVVEALRLHGANVIDTSGLGNGFPDLLVTFMGSTILMEIKDGKKFLSRQKLTSQQIKFHADWTGGPLCIVDGVEAALRVLKVVAGGIK